MSKVGILQAKISSVRRTGKDEVGCGELARIFQLTEQRISQLVKEGMPRTARGSYSLRECTIFYVSYLRARLDENRNETIVAEKIRLTRAKATKAEVEARKIGGSVLDLERARNEIMILAREIKEELLSVPGRMAPVLENLPAGQIKTLLGDEITDALNRVAERIEEHVVANCGSDAANQ
jgi:phage terminase Nu1 subunit (DNA packaging protein)